MGADIDVALRDIPAGAGIDVGGLEGVGGGRQGHAHRARARPYRFDANARDEVAMLLGGGCDIEVPRVMPPNAERQTAEEQQQRAEAEQSSTGTTAAVVVAGRPPLGVSVSHRMLEHTMIEVGHSELLRQGALRGFANGAFPAAARKGRARRAEWLVSRTRGRR